MNRALMVRLIIAPPLMSVTVLAMAAIEIARFGLHAPHHDESGADHLAMLLMFGQLPIVLGLAALRWQTLTRRAALIMGQASLWVLAFVGASLT